MRRVIWSAGSLANLHQIASYIEDFNAAAAERLAERIRKAAMSLAENPNRGRVVRARVRELTVISPYIIRYRIDAEDVLILRVRHGARRPTR